MRTDKSSCQLTNEYFLLLKRLKYIYLFFFFTRGNYNAYKSDVEMYRRARSARL